MTDNPRHNIRDVRSPRGPELTCRTWTTEAPFRMLHNNLDAEVAFELAMAHRRVGDRAGIGRPQGAHVDQGRDDLDPNHTVFRTSWFQPRPATDCP